MTDQELHALCLQYGEWCRTRRFFAPPVPGNLLAQFQPKARGIGEPDGELLPEMPYFNMAVHGLAEQEPEEAICFALFYNHGFRPVKSIAAAMGISRRTFYYRMYRFAERAYKMSGVLRRASESVQ